MNRRFPAPVSFLLLLVVICAYPGMTRASTDRTAPAQARTERKAGAEMTALIPELSSLKEQERSSYFPDNLYEYIDGAAESYLSYDFRELAVVQFTKAQGSDASLTLEIYDMGGALNAFGIFSSERYPDNTPIQVGDLAYAEGDAMNVLVGRYYVKIVSFGLGDDGKALALEAGTKVAASVKDKGRLPGLLTVFPKTNIIAQSEKYIKGNFLGHAFLHDAFVASYKLGGQEAEAFLISGASEKEAEEMLKALLEFYLQEKLIPAKMDSGYHIKDKYGQHIFLNRVRNVICGLTRVPDGIEAEGELLAKKLSEAAAGRLGNKQAASQGTI